MPGVRRPLNKISTTLLVGKFKSKEDIYRYLTENVSASFMLDNTLIIAPIPFAAS